MSVHWRRKLAVDPLAIGIAHAARQVDWCIRGVLLSHYNTLHQPMRVRVVSGMSIYDGIVYGLIAMVECGRPVLEPPISIKWFGTVGPEGSSRLIRFKFGYPRAELIVEGGALSLRDLEYIRLATNKLEPLVRT